MRSQNPLLEVAVTIVVPALILMRGSDADALGPINALLLALAFPVGWGLHELRRHGKPGWMAALGLVSVLLTGGIGLLALDPKWLAIKEAAVPGAIGLAVLLSAYSRYPLVKTLLYNPALLDTARIDAALAARGLSEAFARRQRLATLLIAGTFFFSSAMNYLLASWVVTSPAGTPAFNAELGRLTLLSYPVIALPSMLMLAGVLYGLARTIRSMTGLTFAEVLHSKPAS